MSEYGKDQEVAQMKRDNMRKECSLYKHLIVTSACSPTNFLRTGSIAFLKGNGAISS